MDSLGSFAWLAAYVFMNLFTTVLNKMLLETYELPFPSEMSFWHYLCSAIGSVFVVRVLRFTEPASLDRSAHIKLFLFSILFNVNILVSTVSLHMVSMALHQIVRALVPAFTVTIMYLWNNKHYPLQIHLSLFTIFIGVGIYAWRGEIDYTAYGMLLTLFGAFLAAFKTVATNVFMVGSLKLHPLDLLQYMCSYAALQMFVVLMFTGQMQTTVSYLMEHASANTWYLIIINGIGAFLLNVVSFVANKQTSPLAMNIGGIAKQVIAIVFGVVWFHTTVTSMSVIGILVTCAGIVWYTLASFSDKRNPPSSADLEKAQRKESLV
eukprot:m.245420 g.245420  ORF g.245420 m.245420 type:complete len:322 (+) comp14703_c0_seq1:38-1003(+)